MHNNSSSRRDFLKKISIALGSLVLISGFDLKKSMGAENKADKSLINENLKFKLVSKSEANDIIKKENLLSEIHVKPESAPLK